MTALFTPLKIKDVTLRNRIAVSPMCQYSSEDGVASDWHLVHLGSRAVGGAGVVIAEATAVSPEGRISPADAGIWAEKHIEPMQRITRFLKSHGSVPGIQIAHAGRKASAARPWEGDGHLTPDQGGWEILGPSAVAFGGNLPIVPREMTVEDIVRVRNDFVSAAKRSLVAGFEWLELHFAHGYLASSFLSPIANKRTDQYGGSFENRARFLVETFTAVREVWPDKFPMTVRLSTIDFNEGGIQFDESIELVRQLKSRGLDLIDVSMGFNAPDISQIPWGPGFMVPYAGRMKRETGVATAAGWMITDAKQAEQILSGGDADLIMLARAELADPYWPFHAAQTLGVDTPQSILPIQNAHWLKQRK